MELNGIDLSQEKDNLDKTIFALENDITLHEGTIEIQETANINDK